MIKIYKNTLKELLTSKIRYLLKKQTIIETIIDKTEVKLIRFLKPRVDFTSNKKIFEYKNKQEYKINRLQLKNKLLYTDLTFDLTTRYGYYRNKSIIKKYGKKKKWYKTYNKLNDIKYFLLKKKLIVKTIRYNRRTIKQKHNNIFLLKNDKFHSFNFIGIRKDLFLKKGKAIKYIKGISVDGVIFITSNIKFVLLKTQRKLIRTFRLKNKIFWYMLNKINECSLSLNKLQPYLSEKLKINNNFILKYCLKISYFKFLIKFTFLILKRASYLHYYFAKHLVYYFYKVMLNSWKFIKKNKYLISVNKTLNKDTLVVSNNLLNLQIKFLSYTKYLKFKKEILSNFLNYIYCLFFKNKNIGFLHLKKNKLLIRLPKKLPPKDLVVRLYSFLTFLPRYKNLYNKLRFIRLKRKFFILKKVKTTLTTFLSI